MSSRARISLSSIVLAGPVALVMIGCAHREVAQPMASMPTAPASDTDITATTGAVVPGNVNVSSTVSLSKEILDACHIHFSDVSEAPKFEFDKSELRPDDQAVLSQVAECVTTGPLAGKSMTLVGRADPRGEVEYNFLLGEHRASSVEQYLHSLGVGADKMTATSRGKLDATGTDESSWQRDRRVDIDLR
jgi:peptidoglycan-associated lipoprotein